MIAGLFFLYTDNETAPQPAGLIAEDTAQNIETYVKETDRDKDGLFDWEETLWHTDPQKTDSDGDGTKDSDEVTQNRDPAKAGPNDELSRADVSGSGSASAGTAATTSLTVTQTVSREMFASYLTLKQSGQLNEENQQKLIDAIVEDTQKRVAPPSISITQLHIEGSGAAAMKAYSEKLKAVMLPLATAQKQNEFVLLQGTLLAADSTAASDFATMIARYKQLADAMKTMTVPAEAAQLHLELINGILAVTDQYEALSVMRTDPIRAYAAARTITETQARIDTAAQALGALFKKYGLQ